MQTFLPYSDFEASARALDRSRLGKQRVETLQMLNALAGLKKGWRNHSATRMWEGYERALVLYGVTICKEWIRRGYRDTTLPKIAAFGRLYRELKTPHWLGDETLHASHRSNLLRKLPDFYGQFDWKESDDLPYVWPRGNAT